MENSNKKALLIGINYFGSSCELQGCHFDITDVMAYLKTLGFKNENITVLMDSANDKQYLFPDCPTKNNILLAMKKIVIESIKGDTLYIHYSGHGSNQSDLNKDELDRRDESIVPVDYEKSDVIIDDMLNDILVNALPYGVKSRVVFDSCHSGSCLDLPVLWKAGTRFEIENKEVENKDIIFISGCRDSQFSSDSAFIHPNGALTRFYLDSLNEIKNSGKMASTYTWKDLGEMIRFKLRKEGYDQVPQLSFEHKSQLLKYVDLL
jgi:hypothetical protein